MRYDVTVPLRPGIPAYPGEAGPVLELLKARRRGDAADVGRLLLSLHTGTHVDAPTHFLDGGGGVETLPLDALVGPCLVLDVEAAPDVSAAALEARLGGAVPDRLLLRTRNSTGAPPLWAKESFDPGFAAIGHDAARWLADRRVRLVGIDYLSVEPFGAAEPLTHLALLGAGVVVVEGLDLRAVPPGLYQLTCLPALLPGADGAPARVLLETRAS